MSPGELAGIVVGGFVLLLAATYGLNMMSSTTIPVSADDIDKLNAAEYGRGSIAEMYRPSGAEMYGGAYTVPCTLPGFEWLGDWFNKTYFPQGIVLSSSVLFYYLWFLVNTSRPQIFPGIIIGIILFGQGVSLSLNGCFGNDSSSVVALKVIFGSLFGAIMGGIGYAIVKNTDKIPFSSFSEEFTTFSSTKEENKTPAKKMVVDVFGPPPASKAVSGDSACITSGNGKCLPPNDEDQFVCEAYRNGELVTSTIVN